MQTSTAPIPIKSAWLQKTIENLVVSFKSEETRQWLQVFIVDPVLSYVMDRFFPYILLCIIIVAAMILLTISTFLIVFFKMGGNGTPSTATPHKCSTCAV